MNGTHRQRERDRQTEQTKVNQRAPTSVRGETCVTERHARCPRWRRYKRILTSITYMSSGNYKPRVKILSMNEVEERYISPSSNC